MATSTAAASAVLEGLAAARSPLEDLYRDLHQHPELSHQEERTARVVAEWLTRDGYEVQERVGGTGVVGVLRNGEGPTVLMRADMDALPVQEATGLPYASTETVSDGAGAPVPVMHACGHDVHVTCLLGAAQLLATHRQHWRGTAVVLFQPGEEAGDGARRMVEDRLAERIPRPDVALAQHVLPLPAGIVATRPGAVLSAADSMRITVFGRGAHGSMPQAAVDPVVLAAMIVLRLQTVVSREVTPGEFAVLTVGSLQAGTKSNVIPDRAVIDLNIRTYDPRTRQTLLSAIERIVTAECQASNAPRAPVLELHDSFPPTSNDAEATARVAAAFAGVFGERARVLDRQTASEDFSDIPNALGVPYTYWGIGGVDPALYAAAAEAGRLSRDVPVNHSATFAPVVQPTLDVGTRAMVTAALAWLGTRGA